MPCVPSSLDALLLLFGSCFTGPSFQTFRARVVGQVSQTGFGRSLGCLWGRGCRGYGITAARTGSSARPAGLWTSSG